MLSEDQTKDLFRHEQKECFNLFDEKQQQYGNTIHKTGLLGATVELIGAVARLPIMVLRNPTHGRDVQKKLRDVLMDIHNYAVIGLVMLDGDNWEGKE